MSISEPVGGISKVFRNFSNSDLYNRGRNAYSRVMNKTKFGKKVYSFTAGVKNWFKRHLIQMTIFDNMGYSIIGPIDGHNLNSLEKAFKKAQKMKKSCVVYLKTVKGKGYKYSENDALGVWHGVNKFNVETGEITTFVPILPPVSFVTY